MSWELNTKLNGVVAWDIALLIALQVNRTVYFPGNQENFDLIVIGGGAAGFYGAIQAADIRPGLKILILE